MHSLYPWIGCLMARPATGTLVEPKGDRKSWGIRFTAAGKRRFVSLGRPEDGWTQTKAEEALADELAAVRLGVWKPREAPKPVAAVSPAGDTESFHEFSEVWFEQRSAEWKPNTTAFYKSLLECHVLPAFGESPLSAITAESIDRYAVAKQREGKLSNNSINSTLECISMILELAVDWERIPANVAKGKKRRLKGEPRRRLHVEPEQLPSLLEACKLEFRPLVATMALAGLRISEAVALTWDDVNLASGVIRVRDSKTAAGIREVDMPLALADELRALKARTNVPLPGNRIFRTVGGRKPMTKRNASDRIKRAIRVANERLSKLGISPIDPGVSAHSLRRLYASLRFGAGDDVVYVSEQIGHESAEFSMRVYAKAIRRRDKLSGDHLREFDKAIELARIGTKADEALGEPAADRIREPF